MSNSNITDIKLNLKAASEQPCIKASGVSYMELLGEIRDKDSALAKSATRHGTSWSVPFSAVIIAANAINRRQGYRLSTPEIIKLSDIDDIFLPMSGICETQKFKDTGITYEQVRYAIRNAFPDFDKEKATLKERAGLPRYSLKRMLEYAEKIRRLHAAIDAESERLRELRLAGVDTNDQREDGVPCGTARVLRGGA